MVVKYKDFTPEKKASMREASLRYYNANKEKVALKARRWRENNKDYVLEKQREDKRKRKLWAIDYLGGECKKCKQTYHPAIYEFHHLNPATKDRDPLKC